VTSPITIGSVEITALIGDSVCDTEVCEFSVLYAAVLDDIVACSNAAVDDDVILARDVSVVELCADEAIAESGLLLVDDEIAVLRLCEDNDSAAGVAPGAESLEIVVVLVARIFACEATALAAAGYVSVNGVQAVYGHPEY